SQRSASGATRRSPFRSALDHCAARQTRAQAACRQAAQSSEARRPHCCWRRLPHRRNCRSGSSGGAVDRIGCNTCFSSVCLISRAAGLRHRGRMLSSARSQCHFSTSRRPRRNSLLGERGLLYEAAKRRLCPANILTRQTCDAIDGRKGNNAYAIAYHLSSSAALEGAMSQGKADNKQTPEINLTTINSAAIAPQRRWLGLSVALGVVG